MTIAIELYKPGITGLGQPPKRIYAKRNQIPAVNCDVLKGLKGITVVMIHEDHIFQVSGYDQWHGMYNYLVNPDGTLARSF